MLTGTGDKRQDLLLQANDHAVEEGAHSTTQRAPLDRTAQRRQECLQAVQVDLRAAAQLHSLLIIKRLAGATDGEERDEDREREREV